MINATFNINQNENLWIKKGLGVRGEGKSSFTIVTFQTLLKVLFMSGLKDLVFEPFD